MTDHYEGELSYQVFTPPGFEGDPTTTVDLLERARTVLEEEGRWITGSWFYNEHPEVDPEDAFCNNWKVCADGALLVVSYGVARRWRHAHTYDQEAAVWRPGWRTEVTTDLHGHPLHERVEEARRFLETAATEAVNRKKGFAWAKNISHVTYNDSYCETRTEMLAIFDRAIALAREAVTV